MTPRPEISQLVLVHTDDFETALHSRVEDIPPGQLSIAYPSDGQTDYELPVGTELQLEWLVGRGLGTVDAVVVGRRNLGVPTLTVDFVSEPTVNQRREHARADLVLDVEVWPDADCEEPVTGVTLDISAGGMRAALATPLEPDSIVRFAVALPDGDPLEGLVRVIEQREDCVACEFHDIVFADRERIVRAVFASYRRDASVRRPS
ncbi:MAG TPA: PilZ domain-containing protein [Gaiellaceae bacterium]|nr:PilZ domain-containing protein [Gaiellaceae bacterium]